MTASAPALPVETGPSRRAIALGVALASLSGAAIVLHTFGPIPLRVSTPLIVLPGAMLLAGLLFASRRQYRELDRLYDRALSGIVWGLIGTLVYDAIRPGLVWVFDYEFQPYKAIPMFGHLITGRPKDDWIAIASGWGYHFWNGLSFGLMFALVRPRGGPLYGLAWAMILEGLMVTVYPSFLGVSLWNEGFLWAGIVGHAAWGLVLGEGLRRYGRG
ncbi:MAG: hypothetical protein ABI782_08265 [Anaerolineaceae bacterium]